MFTPQNNENILSRRTELYAEMNPARHLKIFLETMTTSYDTTKFLDGSFDLEPLHEWINQVRQLSDRLQRGDSYAKQFPISLLKLMVFITIFLLFFDGLY